MRIAALLALAACGFHGKGAPIDPGDGGPDDNHPTIDMAIVDGSVDGMIDARLIDAPPDARSDAMIDAFVDDWWDHNWHYRRRITVDNATVATTLAAFPVLVRLPPTFDFNHAKIDGSDLRFVTDAGTVMPYEIDGYGLSSGNVWVSVSIPAPPAGDPQFWLYYGNGAATSAANPTVLWAGNTSVHHLSNASDSTANNHDGILGGSGNSPAFIDDGRIGKAADFDGGNDKLPLTGESAYDFTNAMTVSVWTRLANNMFAVAYQCFVCKGDKSWRLQRENGSKHAQFAVTDTTDQNDNSTISSVNIDQGWHLVTGVYDNVAQKKRIYIDGALSDEDNYSATLQNTAFAVVLGENEEAGGRNHHGTLDELRITSAVRNSDWIEAEFTTVNDPTFVTLGAGEFSP